MRKVALDQEDNFEALSYVWGDITDVRSIRCDSGSLNVIASLYEALQHLRNVDKPRTLWVDAICIDQSNVVERNAQVARMRDIYAKAYRTIIWLGSDAELMENLHSSIEQSYVYFPEPVTREIDAGCRPPDMKDATARTMFELQPQGKPNLFEHEWERVLRLITRPWFIRKWIVQEAVYARELAFVCGHLTVSFDKVWKLVEALYATGLGICFEVISREMNHACRGAFVNLHLIGRFRASLNPESARSPLGLPPTLLHLVVFGHAFYCSDKRDNVFGMLGLACNVLTVDEADRGPYFPVPDYSLTSDQVFSRYTLWELLEKGHLGILSLRSKKEPGTMLPSWVPDLSALQRLWYWAQEDTGFETFKAGGKGRPCIHCMDERLLRIKGYVVDTVASLQAWEDLVQDIEDLDESAKQVRLWLRRSLNFAAKSDGEPSDVSDARFEQFSRTMMRDSDPTGKRAPVNLPAILSRYLRLIDLYYTVGLNTEDQEDLIKHGTLVESQVAATAALRLFWSGKDRLGALPWEARVGDTICVFKGAVVPHVLRRGIDGNYTLVGECYVYGIMDGEVLTFGDAVEETITIE